MSTPRPHHPARLLATACALLLLGPSAHAAAYDWTAASGSTWATGWTGGNVPTLADDLTILGPLNSPGALSINVAANANAGSLVFTNTDATSLINSSGSNKTLTIQGGLTTGSGAVTIGSTTANQNVSISLVSGYGQTWNIGSGGLTLNNGITRNTGASVNFVTGSGVVTTAPAITLNRGVFYNGDYAVADAGGAIGAVVYGTTSNTFNVSGAIGTVATNSSFYNLTGNASISSQNLGAGGTLRFGGNHTLSLSGANTISGFLTNGATAAVISGSGTLRVNGEMVFATNGGVSDKLTVSGNVTTFNGGVITTVTKTGLGALVLSGNNTYNGDTYVSQGTLRSTSSTGLGFGGSMSAINVGNSKTSVAAGATLDLAPSSAMTVNEVIVLNGGALINSGAGTTTIDNGIAAINLTNLGSGGSAASGTVDIVGSGTGATATVSVASGAITGFQLTAAGSGYTSAPTVSINIAGQTIASAATAILSSVALNGSANTIGGSGNLIINAIIANGTSTGGFSKIGAGTVTLNGANTYTGVTTVTEGTLALGAADRIANTGNLVMAGGTFATGGFGETLGTLTLAANSIIDLGSGASALVFADSSATSWTSSVSLSFVNFTEGVDSIRIGTSSGGLTGGQLAQITLNGQLAAIDANGFLTVSSVPEPSAFAALAGAAMLGLAAVRRRRTA